MHVNTNIANQKGTCLFPLSRALSFWAKEILLGYRYYQYTGIITLCRGLMMEEPFTDGKTKGKKKRIHVVSENIPYIPSLCSAL
jgi:hypothetical protein